jgi:hypothetical protein
VTRLALRGLAARKLRTSLTVIAVLLGVTMIAGTFVLTDTIQKAFDDIFTSQTKGADVVVTGKTAVKTDFAQPRPLDEALLAKIKQIPDVTQVAGQVNDTAAVVGKDGKIVKTGGSPRAARPLGRTRSRSTPAPPTRRTSRSATRSRSPPRSRSASSSSSASPASATRPASAGRRW